MQVSSSSAPHRGVVAGLRADQQTGEGGARGLLGEQLAQYGGGQFAAAAAAMGERGQANNRGVHWLRAPASWRPFASGAGRGSTQGRGLGSATNPSKPSQAKRLTERGLHQYPAATNHLEKRRSGKPSHANGPLFHAGPSTPTARPLAGPKMPLAPGQLAEFPTFADKRPRRFSPSAPIKQRNVRRFRASRARNAARKSQSRAIRSASVS